MSNVEIIADMLKGWLVQDSTEDARRAFAESVLAELAKTRPAMDEPYWPVLDDPEFWKQHNKEILTDVAENQKKDGDV